MRGDLTVDRDSLFEELGYTPHSEGQWAAHNSEARFRTACCGRRWGKSQWAGHEMTLRMFVPDSINWICGPQYVLASREFQVVYNDFRKLGLLKRCRSRNNVKQGDMMIYFPDLNSNLLCTSAQKPDSLVGEGLDHVIMSEAAKHLRSTWERFIEPALSDKKGSADFPSTPQGFNWFKEMYDFGMDPEAEDYDSWHFPTWTNAAAYSGYDDPELVRIRSKSTGMFWDQEYAAKFTAYEGMIYQDFDLEVHVKRIPYNPTWQNYRALDFGFKDPTICLDIMVDQSDRVYVWREYVQRQTTASDNAVAIAQRPNPEGYHVDSNYADPRGADEIATMQFLLGYIEGHAVGRPLGIEEVARALKVREDGLPGLIIDPSCKNLIQEIQGYHAKPTREGTNEKAGDIPTEGPDHSLDALRYFFNERFIIGGGQGLADIYNGYEMAGRDTFFTNSANFTYTDKPGWR